MLFIVFWKVMSWILLFHLLFWCHKIILRETSYGMVFGTISLCWEQTLTIFDDILLEETAHVQPGNHTRKSWKAWKNSAPWKKCQGRPFVSAVSSSFEFFTVLGIGMLPILYLFYTCIPYFFTVLHFNKKYIWSNLLFYTCFVFILLFAWLNFSRYHACSLSRIK